MQGRPVVGIGCVFADWCRVRCDHWRHSRIGPLDAFIVTLGMMGVARGVAKALASEQTIPVYEHMQGTWLAVVMRALPAKIRRGTYPLLRVFGSCWPWLLYLPYYAAQCVGRHVYAME